MRDRTTSVATRRRRTLLRCATLLLPAIIAALAFAQDAAPQPVRVGPEPFAGGLAGRMKLLEHDNGDASPWAEFFAFDSPAHPKLVQLREEYKLDEMVKDAATDLERACILKEWVAGALKFGTPAPIVFKDWSAVALLERAKNNEPVWCGQAAMVFQQACMAAGIPARFIEVGVPNNPACHFTTEVYLREHNKWAVLDATPMINVYYTVDDVPQSALEMHRHVVRDEMATVVEVRPDRSQPARRGMAYAFYYVRWLTRCDVVTNTPVFVNMENVFDRMRDTVEWRDDEMVPWDEQTLTAWWVRNMRLAAWNTSDPAVVDWQVTDRVRMILRPDRGGTVSVQLWTADLNVHHLQYSTGGDRWRDLPVATRNEYRDNDARPRRVSLRPRRGENEIRVRIVRPDGTTGPESYVKFKRR